MTSRYATLPFIALLIRLLGYLFLAMSMAKTVLIAVASQAFEDLPSRIVRLVDMLFTGVIVCVLLIAISECIHVLMDIEWHTRRAADAATNSVTGTTPRRNAGDHSE